MNSGILERVNGCGQFAEATAGAKFNWEADAQIQPVEMEITLVKEQGKVNAKFCNLYKITHISAVLACDPFF